MDLNDCFSANNSFHRLKNKVLSKEDIETLPLLILAKDTRTRIRLDD